MKKYFSIIITTLLGLLSSCQDYSPEKPQACLIISVITGYNQNGQPIYQETNTCKVGQAVYFSSCSTADKFAVYSGASGAVYGEAKAIGSSLSSDPDAIVSKVYTSPGTYTVTLVATNFSMGSTDVELESSNISKELVVTN